MLNYDTIINLDGAYSQTLCEVARIHSPAWAFLQSRTDEALYSCIHVFMDSYTTDFISSAKEISMHSPVSVCAIVRVVYISNFTLYLVLMLMVFSFSVFQKVIISIG